VSGILIKESSLIANNSRLNTKFKSPLLSGFKRVSPKKFLIFNQLLAIGNTKSETHFVLGCFKQLKKTINERKPIFFNCCIKQI